ncbi:hypothetical protein B7463_g2217, partial [Scytalidium lignicola]
MAYNLAEEGSGSSPEIFRQRLSLPESTASPIRQENPVPENTVLQIAWDSSMEGLGGVGLPHRKTAVLMISWAEELDDLHTTTEVNALEAIFKDFFRYTVIKKQLGSGKRAQIQVQKYLGDFVYEHDGDGTLLIVYYAGHGIPGKRGELKLSGKRPQGGALRRDLVVWHEAEYIIKSAEADVLVIFDCCFAGNLGNARDRGRMSRNFEFLAACDSEAVTKKPGPTSFTSALIWSLEKLVKTRVRFTTTELVSEINNAPNFPTDQKCHIVERDDEPCLHKLVLGPLPSPENEESEEYAPKNTQQKKINLYLDLRFFYEKAPGEDEIRRLSRSLRDLIANHEISTNHITWAGLKRVDVIRSVIERWKSFEKNPTTPLTPNPQHMSPIAQLRSERDLLDRRNSAPITVPNMDVENLKVELITVDQASRHTSHQDGEPKEPHYIIKIFIVGVSGAIVEYFHRNRPAETLALIPLPFCAYALYTTALHANIVHLYGPPRTLNYFSLVVSGISLPIVLRLFWIRG